MTIDYQLVFQASIPVDVFFFFIKTSVYWTILTTTNFYITKKK